MSALRIAKAVAAGLAATWFMDRADELIYAAQPERNHRREAELADVTSPASHHIAYGVALEAQARLLGLHDDAR